MSETTPEATRPQGGFARMTAIALVLAGALWVATSLREDPGQAPVEESASVAVVEPPGPAVEPPGPAEVPAILEPEDASTTADVEQLVDDAGPAPVGTNQEELERRAAMARRTASRGRDPVQILVQDAERLLEEGRNDEAIERAHQAMRERKSPQAYAVETRALCAKGDADGARRAFKRVLGSQREPTLSACAERGIQLLSE